MSGSGSESESDPEAETENGTETEVDVQSIVEEIANRSEDLDDRLAALKRAVIEGDDDSEVMDVAEDLWDVLVEIQELLETIDFEEVPEAIDFDELAENIDVEEVPEGLLDEDEAAIELENVHEAINLRELWDAVDLTDLRQQKRELDDAVEDVTGDGSEDGEDDLIGVNDVVDMGMGEGEGANVQFDAETCQEAIQDTIEKAAEKFRSLLLDTHDKLRVLYEANQEKLGQPGRHPDSRNPTATSTLPPGPLPDSASTRTSTVPSQVRHSKVKNSRRIYGRRFEEGDRDE